MREVRTRIVGVQYHPGAQTRLNVLPHGAEVVLRREPANPHDPNAVAVTHDGQMLGYVPRDVAPAVSEALDDDAHLIGPRVTARVEGHAPCVLIRW